MLDDVTYSRSFYESLRATTERSAAAVVPLVLLNVEIAGHMVRSVLDVGCGTGEWLSAFKGGSCVEDVIGVDGDWVPRDRLSIYPDEFRVVDISRPFDLDRRFDLAVCLEVAEHLPLESADDLVESICSHAPVILFSAAIPGQRGEGHVNCRWPSWWAERFARRGYRACDPFRSHLWSNRAVAWWYRQNLVLFLAPDACVPLGSVRNLGDIDLVHPEHWRERIAC